MAGPGSTAGAGPGTVLAQRAGVMPGPTTGSLRRLARGAGRALRRCPGVFGGVTLALAGVSILGPPALLSLFRERVDYFTFNPWLPSLPAYVADPTVPLARKVEKLPALALFWFSADSPFGGVDWGFAVDVTDVARILVTASLFGLYFALWALLRREHVGAPGRPRAGGAAGLAASLFGLTTGPCSVMGCGAPVIPVVGLVFAGLSSGTLTLLAAVSRAATWLVLVLLVAGVTWLSWRAGGRTADPPAPPGIPAR